MCDLNFNNKEIGKIGESLACKYLINKGYKILNRNYQKRCGEIDIIARNDLYLVFLEVKVRKVNAMVSGIEAVDIKKQKKIINTDIIYLTEFETNLQPRFDVIEINYYCRNNSRVLKNINHIENAFSWEEDFNDEIF